MKPLRKKGPRSKIILSPQHLLGYIEIPKAGCSSIKLEFAKLLELGIDKMRVHEHTPGQFIHSKSDFSDYFIFTFVRNPFSRILSAYKSKIMPDQRVTDKLINGVPIPFYKRYGNKLYGGMSFKNFVKQLEHIPDNNADKHFVSQCHLLRDVNDNPLYDYVGKLESIGSDFKKMKDLHNIPLDTIGHFVENKTSGSHYSCYYDEEMIRIITKRYAEDLEIFDYKYENLYPETFKDPQARHRKFTANWTNKNIHLNLKIENKLIHKGIFVLQTYNEFTNPDKTKFHLKWKEVKIEPTENKNLKSLSFNIPNLKNHKTLSIIHRNRTNKTNYWTRVISRESVQ